VLLDAVVVVALVVVRRDDSHQKAMAATISSTAAISIQRRNRLGERAFDRSRVRGKEAEIRIDTLDSCCSVAPS
jgi:hypothetical protein